MACFYCILCEMMTSLVFQLVFLTIEKLMGMFTSYFKNVWYLRNALEILLSWYIMICWKYFFSKKNQMRPLSVYIITMIRGCETFDRKFTNYSVIKDYGDSIGLLTWTMHSIYTFTVFCIKRKKKYIYAFGYFVTTIRFDFSNIFFLFIVLLYIWKKILH